MTLEDRLKARRQPNPSDPSSGPGVPREPSPATPPNQSSPQSQAVSIVAPFVRTNLVRLAFSRKDRFNRRRGLETHWYQCLLFPLRASPLIIALASSLAVMTGLALMLAKQGGLEVELTWDWLARLLWLAIPVLIGGYTCGFLDCTLASAAAGEMALVRWPGRNVSLALKSLITWLACFLAGPIIPAWVSYLYWTQCGDLEVVDWLILAELGIVTLSYWLLAILAVSVRDRLADANPVQIIALVRRVGIRLPVTVLAAATGFLGLLLLALNAIVLLHNELLAKQSSGLLILVGYWFSALFLATFLFRLLGLWCYQSGAAPESKKNA
jgi:hypothetical protein